jgi:hypothetical protein
MSFLCNPLTLLHHERCIASSPHGDVCQESIDFTTRGFAHRELVLSEQEPRSEARATNLRNAARLMICDNHKNRSQEARRIARLWGKQTAQQSNAIIHSPASTEVPTYKQSPHSQISFEGCMHNRITLVLHREVSALHRSRDSRSIGCRRSTPSHGLMGAKALDT